jgi:hypothetical protein
MSEAPSEADIPPEIKEMAIDAWSKATRSMSMLGAGSPPWLPIAQAIIAVASVADYVVAEARSALPTAILNTIYADPHMWSKRPCATCAAVSKAVGKPFGCDRYRATGKL